MKRRAFTLIELIITVTIIGILMTVGVYSYNSISKDSRDSTRKSDLAKISNALQQHYLDLRTYPSFGTSAGNPIYSAGWQLGHLATCSHTATKFLTPKYMAKIPEDPLQRNNLTTQSCSSLASHQDNRYLYLTNTTVAGPATNPTSFGLLATLESPVTTDVLAAANNPLLPGNTGTVFGPWYAGFNNYDPDTIGLKANYMITGTAGR